MRRNHGDEIQQQGRRNLALTMNLAASGTKAVKPLLSLDAFPSSVAGAKTKFSLVAARHWLISKQGKRRSPSLPWKPHLPNKPFGIQEVRPFQGATSDSSSPSQGNPPGVGFSRGHHPARTERSSKYLASFGDGKVNIFQRPKATTLTLPKLVPRGGLWGGSSVCW